MTTPIYFTHGQLVAESGNVRVYKFNDDLYLEGGQGHYLWTISNEASVYERQLGELPRGDCLEVGLGLGFCSSYILSKANVTSLTTVELNPGVINVYKKLNPIVDERHRLVLGNGLDYIISTDRTFDFIFLDFYAIIDEDTIDDIRAMVSAGRRILNPGGKIMGWFDESTPDEFADEFFDLFK